MNFKKGFTLIELLVVVSIIGVLATIVLSSLSQARLKAKDAYVKSSLSSFRTSIELSYPNGNYNSPALCSSNLYLQLRTNLIENGSRSHSCSNHDGGYRIIFLLPSDYAKDEDTDRTVKGFCIASGGLAQEMSFYGEEFDSFENPVSEGGIEAGKCQ